MTGWKRGIALLAAALAVFVMTGTVWAQDEEPAEESPALKELRERFEGLRHRLDQLEKASDDILWFHRLGDVAHIDKVQLTGPPPAKEKNPTAQGAGNPVRFASYIFIPRDFDRTTKRPLLVLPHGGVHGDFNTFYTHIVRELIAQGYVIVAPEYRGSTGYGGRHYRLIDYGGLEIEDVYAARNFILENYDFLDPERVGILGWSHGGLITLMNIFEHPESYKVAFAGVPVSDLVARMGYKTQGYRELYSVDYHIGKSAYENVDEYRRRSPAWNAEKLETPLLIFTNTNDADVNVLEVEHLIKSLKAAEKEFEYEIFQDVPGGHAFDRIDTKTAREARLRIYSFLADHLDPPARLRSLQELSRAGYR
ncbi:MAG TPA: prolyl oligopeptidase family serine peptidase [Acidobacteriota bacterium]|nr:prolyl oligopeptidase family serine peptidase [Acidobacteriota bacterium]